MRSLFAAASLVLVVLGASSCAPRHDVFLAWTIDGADAAQACAQLTDPQVRVQVASRDVVGGTVVDETSTLACVDGTPNGSEAKASITTGNVADIVVEILDGGELYGSSETVRLSPGAEDRHPGHDAEEPLRTDIQLERGRLRATLRVVDRGCADAGAGEFQVTLRRKSSPLGTEVVTEESVACPSEGDALFVHQPVERGDRYEIAATTNIGGVDYATEDGGAGVGVEIESGLTELVVDLDVVGRPD